MATRVTFGPAELARLCGVDAATVHSWMQRGAIAVVKSPGGRARFSREAVLGFVRRYRLPIPPEVRPTSPERTVVYEPDHNVARSIRTVLPHDLKTEQYDDVYSTLLAIGGARPDVVIFEVGDPELDPVRFIAAIRRRHTLLHTMLVVFTTGAAERSAWLEAGADAFVEKPRTRDLGNCVRKLLGRGETQHTARWR